MIRPSWFWSRSWASAGVEPEPVDEAALVDVVLGDRLAIDLGDLGEVRAEVGRRGGPDQEDHPDEDDEAEGEIDVETVPVPVVVAEPARPLGGRLGT